MKKAVCVLAVLLLIIIGMTGCANTQIPAQNAVDTSTFIGEEKAKEIALEKAGITADGVIFDRVELDTDDGVWQYEVEFRKGLTEYDADINAIDGSIRSWDVDLD